MSPETQSAAPFAAATITCPSCRAEMPREMRFCRLCGYRLGEGLSEYVETVRLDGFTASPAPGAGPLAPPRAFGVASYASPEAGAATTTFGNPAGRRRKRARWLVWPLLGLAIVGASGVAAFVSRVGPARVRVSAPAAPRSFFGGGDFTEVDGAGLMVEAVLPGSPAEAAGLYDGDIIKTLDGRGIASEDDLRGVLRATPAGKTIAVEFLRDGELKQTMLTTIRADAYNPRAFAPAGGSGYWGVSGLRRAPVPGTNLYGVRLSDVGTNRPADIAGLKKGDIVVEFDGRPVRTVDGLESYIDHAAPGSVVRVMVFRDGQPLHVDVKMGRD